MPGPEELSRVENSKHSRLFKKAVRQGPSNSHYLSIGERPRLPFTARIERAQFHRARSASKKGTWPLSPLLAGFFNSLLEKFFHRFRWSGQDHLLTLFDNRTLNEIRMGH
jgi:hypothetical protein